MSNQINLKCLEKWISNVSIYPPGEIFFQAPKSQEKKERRCKEICEQLYRFNWEDSKHPNPVGTVREIVREMVVLDKLFEYNAFPAEYMNIVKLVAKFQKHAYHLYHELEDMHKQHPALAEYYKEWRLGLVHIHLNSLHWGADIIRLPREGQYADAMGKQYIDDVERTFKEMK